MSKYNPNIDEAPQGIGLLFKYYGCPFPFTGIVDSAYAGRIALLSPTWEVRPDENDPEEELEKFSEDPYEWTRDIAQEGMIDEYININPKGFNLTAPPEVWKLEGWMLIPEISGSKLKRKIFVEDTAEIPKPGQIWRHHKHNPDTGAWHEYEVLAIAGAGSPTHEAEALYTTATHSETGTKYGLLQSLRTDSDRWWATPALGEKCVLYKNSKSQELWLRPFDMFTDGRFTLIH